MRSVRTPEAPAGAAWVTPFTTREFGGRRKSAMGFSAFSVGARPGRNRLDFARHGVEMHQAVVEAGTPRPLDPYQRVLEPGAVVALREILAGVRAAALGAIGGRVDGGRRLQQQVLELEGLDEIGVPDERAIADPHLGEGIEGRAEPLDTRGEAFPAAKYGGVELHGLLHLGADRRRRALAVGAAQPVEPLACCLAGILRQGPLAARGLEGLRAEPRRLASEDHQIEQRLAPEAVGAVHRHAGRLPDRHEPRDDAVGIAALRADHLAVIVAGNPAHVVVHGRLNRNRLARDVDAREDARRLRDSRQPLVDHGGAEVLEVQRDVIALGADPAPLADLDRHRPRSEEYTSELQSLTNLVCRLLLEK